MNLVLVWDTGTLQILVNVIMQTCWYPVREQSYTAERRCPIARARDCDTREQKDALLSRIVTLPIRIEERLVALRQLDTCANGIRTLTLRARSILFQLLLLVDIAKPTREFNILFNILFGDRVV